MSEPVHGARVLRVIPAAFYLIVPLLCGSRDYVLRQGGRNLRQLFLDAGPVHSAGALAIDAFPNALASYRGRPGARGGKGAREVRVHRAKAKEWTGSGRLQKLSGKVGSCGEATR